LHATNHSQNPNPKLKKPIKFNLGEPRIWKKKCEKTKAERLSKGKHRKIRNPIETLEETS